MSASMGIGVSALRTEDRRFLTGRGRYVDDINLRSQQYAWFVRSRIRTPRFADLTPKRRSRCRESAPY